jgi:hypothetical protein
MAKTQTEVAVVEKKALVAAPAFMDASDFGGGFEGADKDSYAIPFIQILQKMSPMVDEDDPKHVEGAKAGMLYNTVTQRLYDGKIGLTIIPCAYKRSFVQWGGREGDGGFKGEFTPEQIEDKIAKNEIAIVEGRFFVPNEDGSVHEKKNDYFADTRSHFVLIVDEETGEMGQAILALSSTQMKASKMLMTSLQQKKVDTPSGKRTPPTFANKVKLTTVGMSNDKGSWSGVKFELDGLVTDADVYAEAKAFHAAIASGAVKADFAKAPTDTAAGGVSDAPATAEGF